MVHLDVNPMLLYLPQDTFLCQYVDPSSSLVLHHVMLARCFTDDLHILSVLTSDTIRGTPNEHKRSVYR